MVNPHGAAALLLRELFTWADVRRCRDIAHGLEVHYAAGRGLDAAGTGSTIEGWRDLADRIESLLQPRET